MRLAPLTLPQRARLMAGLLLGLVPGLARAQLPLLPNPPVPLNPSPATAAKAPTQSDSKQESAPAKKTLEPVRAPEFPGGILDRGLRTAYVAGASGGIEAIDLATGDVIWQTYEAQIPVLVDGNRLYAQAGVKRNRLRVLTFDLERKGECLAESDPVVLPRWVVTGDAPGRTFTTRWRLEKSQLILDWEATSWSDADKLTTHQEPSTRKRAEGTARIDLETSEVKTGPREKGPEVASARLPRVLDKLVVRWHKTIGRHLVALVLEELPPEEPKAVKDGFEVTTGDPLEANKPQPREEPTPPVRRYQFVLRAWDYLTGEPAPPIVVMKGRRPTVLPALDERVLFFRDAAPSPDEFAKSKPDQFDWQIFSLEKQKIIGRVPAVPGTQAGLLLNGKVFFLVAGPVNGPLNRPTYRPQLLQAYDSNTGKKLWEHPVASKVITPPGW